MSKNVNHVLHVKSSVVQEGKPKLPSASYLLEGELAVNYASGYEVISLKNSSGDVVTFSSDDYYSEKKLGSGFTGANSALTVTQAIKNNELVIATALNDLETRKLDSSAYTITSGDVSNWNSAYESAHTHSNKSYIDSISGDIKSMAYENASSYSSATQIYRTLGTGFSISSVTDVIKENEEITSAALNDLDDRKLDASAYTPSVSAKRITPFASLPNGGAGMTVGQVKTWIANQFNDGAGFKVGQYVYVSCDVVGNWTNDSQVVNESCVYAFIAIGGGYDGYNYAQFLISSYSDQPVGVVGINLGTWNSTIKFFATSDQIPATASDIGILSRFELISSNVSSSCSITGSSNIGKSETIIYYNVTPSDYTVTVPTTYHTPDGAAIELTCVAGGYCEVNYLNVGGQIFARGL